MTSPCRAGSSEIGNHFLKANIECPRLSWYWLIANDGQILNLFERGTFKMGVNFQLGIIWLSIYIINLSRYDFYIFFIIFFSWKFANHLNFFCNVFWRNKSWSLRIDILFKNENQFMKMNFHILWCFAFKYLL